jgi:hypothetical protein
LWQATGDKAASGVQFCVVSIFTPRNSKYLIVCEQVAVIIRSIFGKCQVSKEMLNTFGCAHFILKIKIGNSAPFFSETFRFKYLGMESP